MNRLIQYSKGTKLEIYNNKKAIHYLKDRNRQVVILGSKGFFEGIDIPGDHLNCVIVDKIPNINPTDPLYKALKVYTNIYYGIYNYPKVCIKIKQGYGRLVRSIYDYGYFIILDGGSNKETLKRLEYDLNGPNIKEKYSKEIINTITNDFKKWQQENLREILSEVSDFNLIESFNSTTKKMNLHWEYIEIDKDKRISIFKNDNSLVRLKFDKNI